MYRITVGWLSCTCLIRNGTDLTELVQAVGGEDSPAGAGKTAHHLIRNGTDLTELVQAVGGEDSPAGAGKTAHYNAVGCRPAGIIIDPF